ncbi:MAG: 4'-phosphopantetheinyl transferase superfamily protein [Thermoanaerobaculia bacterium]
MTDFPPRSPAAGLELAPGEIHVWRVPLDPAPEQVESLGRSLSADEWQRAHRFRFDRHRRQYVVGRGALRTLTAAYLGRRPEELQFSYGPRGKPFLAPPFDSLDPRGLQLNLSNSNELALVGFVLGREIGVDVEYLRPMNDCEEIAERFFSESERQTLRTIPFPAKQEAFFNCWTRKEAYLKAVGEGLAAPLDSFDVTLAMGEPPRMLTLKGDATRAAGWFFHHLRPAADYLGAVAIEGGTWEVRTWTFVA